MTRKTFKNNSPNTSLQNYSPMEIGEKKRVHNKNLKKFEKNF